MKKNISFYYGYPSDYKRKTALIQEAGFDGVMAMYKYSEDFFSAIDYALKNGLNVESIHMPFDKIVNPLWVDGIEGDNYVKLMLEGADYASSIGVKKLTVHISSSPIPPPLSEIGFGRLTQIAEYFDKKGLFLCIENLRRIDYFAAVLDNVKGDNVKVCYDSGHHNAYYSDKFDLKPYYDKVFCVHLHDNLNGVDNHYFPFEGSADWSAISYNLSKMKNLTELTLETHGSRYPDKYQTELDFLLGGKKALEIVELMIEEKKNG